MDIPATWALFVVVVACLSPPLALPTKMTRDLAGRFE